MIRWLQIRSNQMIYKFNVLKKHNSANPKTWNLYLAKEFSTQIYRSDAPSKWNGLKCSEKFSGLKEDGDDGDHLIWPQHALKFFVASYWISKRAWFISALQLVESHFSVMLQHEHETLLKHATSRAISCSLVCAVWITTTDDINELQRRPSLLRNWPSRAGGEWTWLNFADDPIGSDLNKAGCKERFSKAALRGSLVNHRWHICNCFWRNLESASNEATTRPRSFS